MSEEDISPELEAESFDSSQASEDMISTGTRSCKVGYASSNFPEVDCPSLIGIPKYNGKISSELCNKDDIYIGTEALQRCPVLSLKYPIEQGVIVDWDEFEILSLNILSH